MNAQHDYQIRYSQRAKRIRLVVSAEKVEVVAPPGVPEQQLHDFAAKKKDWIRATLKKVRQKKQAVKPLAPERYEDGCLIPFKGDFYPLHIQTGDQRRQADLTFNPEQGFTLNIQAQDQHSDTIRLIVRQWMFQQAAEETGRYIQQYAPKYQLWPQQVRIKQQKSRWGSCSVKNNLNINGLLIMTPPQVMAYVVAHELCHIRHKNHSPAFWQLVAEHMPDYQEYRHWLKQNGQRVMCGF